MTSNTLLVMLRNDVPDISLSLSFSLSLFSVFRFEENEKTATTKYQKENKREEENTASCDKGKRCVSGGRESNPDVIPGVITDPHFF